MANEGQIFTTITDNNSSSYPHNLIVINATTQIAFKLTSDNYPMWRAHFNALLVGHNLLGFIDGSKLCPPLSIETEGVKKENPSFLLWKRKDQLLLHAIMASTTKRAMAIIASATTSREAWNKLQRAYANKSRARILALKERLTTLCKGDKSVSEYLQILKTIADDLAKTGSSLDDDDLFIYVLQGLGHEYREVAAALRARYMSLSFEELYDKLVDHESFLKRPKLHRALTT